MMVIDFLEKKAQLRAKKEEIAHQKINALYGWLDDYCEVLIEHSKNQEEIIF